MEMSSAEDLTVSNDILVHMAGLVKIIDGIFPANGLHCRLYLLGQLQNGQQFLYNKLHCVLWN